MRPRLSSHLWWLVFLADMDILRDGLQNPAKLFGVIVGIPEILRLTGVGKADGRLILDMEGVWNNSGVGLWEEISGEDTFDGT